MYLGGGIPLTYSIKSNPFIIKELPENISHVEVCSPGELEICKKYKILRSKIIYSGVNKGYSDILEAIKYNVDIVTIESLRQFELVNKICEDNNIRQRVIIRYTSGNQFGVSKEDIFKMFEMYANNVNIIGVHYYSGTQKKIKSIQKDLDNLDKLLIELKEKYNFTPGLVEYGPGLSSEYFNKDYDNIENNILQEASIVLKGFSKKYKLGIEIGRFLSSGCGIYATKVVDIKSNDGINYVICDGGIHQLKYYGQTMAMQVPNIEVLNKSNTNDNYCICGSLCTVADVIVREVNLPSLNINDVLLFKRCGAYSITEGSSLFLSREIPAVYLYNGKELTKVRDKIETSLINSAN